MRRRFHRMQHNFEMLQKKNLKTLIRRFKQKLGRKLTSKEMGYICKEFKENSNV